MGVTANLPPTKLYNLIENILREFSLVVVFSTLMGLLVSFTLTPLLVSRFGKLEVLNPNTLWGKLNLGFERFLDNLKESYGQILTAALSHRRWVFTSVIVLLIGSIALVPTGFIGAAFMQQGDQGELNVSLELAPTASIYQTNQATQQVEQLLLKHPEVTNVFTNVGYTTSGIATASNSNVADMNVKLVDKKQRKISTENFGSRVKQKIAQIPRVRVTVSPYRLPGIRRLQFKSPSKSLIWCQFGRQPRRLRRSCSRYRVRGMCSIR